jgi:putative lipoic acid-binding regulatory protein
MNDAESLLEFPCRFPIKVMGRDRPDFEAHVIELIGQHTDPVAAADIAVRSSSKGKFIALTVTVAAESRAQLDDIYRALSASDLVLYLI